MAELPVRVILAIERASLALSILLGLEILLVTKSAQCIDHLNELELVR
jgi:hypothetical protein